MLHLVLLRKNASLVFLVCTQREFVCRPRLDNAITTLAFQRGCFSIVATTNDQLLRLPFRHPRMWRIDPPRPDATAGVMFVLIRKAILVLNIAGQGGYNRLRQARVLKNSILSGLVSGTRFAQDVQV